MIKTITTFFSLGLSLCLSSQILIKDINPNGASSPIVFGNIGDTLLLYAHDDVNGKELWMSDGTESGTELLKDIQPGATRSNFPTSFIKIGSEYFFIAAHSGSFGISLWKTNGKSSGTVMVKDLGSYKVPQGGGFISALPMIGFKGNVFFVLDDNEGKELWISDGTSNGTKMLKNINIGFQTGSNPIGFIEFKDYLYFFANDGINGNELWRTDGTENGTVLFKDIYPGAISSFESGIPSLFIFKDHLYFGAQGTHDEGVELYRTDGTDNGTELFKDINTNVQASSFPAFIGVTDNFLLFRATTPNEGAELWISDGTVNGTKLLKDINEGNGSSFPSFAIELNGKLIFPASQSATGYELWVSDGTANGTYILKDINPGPTGGYYGNLTKFKNRIFFSATDDVNGVELWETNGSIWGTKLYKDLNPGADASNVKYLYVLNDRLYFSAAVEGTNEELYAMEPGEGVDIRKIQFNNNNIYPNPIHSNQELKIEVDFKVESVKLVDAMGKQITLTATQNGTWLIPSVFSAGIYTLEIKSEYQYSYQSLIIQP
jgi:ELWxxDGT repeat protein